MTCEKCERGSMHTHLECTEPCVKGEHDVEAINRSYGYWRGQCTKCKRVWEVDSSG